MPLLYCPLTIRIKARRSWCFREEVELIRETTTPFDLDAFLAGKQTPVFFGSAISNFGIQNLLDGFLEYAPTPKNRKSDIREVKPEENKLTGFVFKIQANMDPKHHDRLAFMRLVSGQYNKGMKVLQVSTGKQIKIAPWVKVSPILMPP
jgi:peptide chain release factor 3